jgi:hypothetical protein
VKALNLMALLAAAVLALLVAPSSDAGVARRKPVFVSLSDGGPQFLSYDGRPNLQGHQRDWPVSLVFSGTATIAKVKRALRSAGLTRGGGVEYLAYRTDSATLRVDADRGLKTHCDANGSDIHVRLYAPSVGDRFVDPVFGSVVVGTAHVDHADGCGSPPQAFGFSEQAEQSVATLLARQGWRVERNRLALDNAEPYRRDVEDPAHVWWSDGRATLIEVP